MKGYVDLYILPLPKKNLAAYRRIAQQFGKVIEDHGALEYREWVGDDLNVKGMTAFPSKIKLKPGEVLISSVVEFRSKSHRNQVNKKAMNDPRMKALMAEKPLFDMKRMLYGGFSTIVKMGGHQWLRRHIPEAAIAALSVLNVRSTWPRVRASAIARSAPRRGTGKP